MNSLEHRWKILMKYPQFIARLIITVFAILAIIIYHLLGPFDIDNVTIVLLIIAALPWLSFLFKSIELPGFGKFEL